MYFFNNADLGDCKTHEWLLGMFLDTSHHITPHHITPHHITRHTTRHTTPHHITCSSLVISQPISGCVRITCDSLLTTSCYENPAQVVNISKKILPVWSSGEYRWCNLDFFFLREFVAKIHWNSFFSVTWIRILHHLQGMIWFCLSIASFFLCVVKRLQCKNISYHILHTQKPKSTINMTWRKFFNKVWEKDYFADMKRTKFIAVICRWNFKVSNCYEVLLRGMPYPISILALLVPSLL